MQFLFNLWARCPLRFLHFVGWFLGWLVFLASPTYRRRFLENAQKANYSFKEVRSAVSHAGYLTAELPRLWFGKPFSCEWIDNGCTRDAFLKKRGVIFLSPHIGCFEIAPQSMAKHFSDEFGAITVLYRPARQAWLARLLSHARTKKGIQTAPTDLSGVRQLIKALRNGQAVGLLPDQVPPEGLGVWSPFFGQSAYTMTLSARLAQQTGAAILLVRSERLSCGRGFKVHVRPFTQTLNDDLPQAVTQINQAMEDLIRESPKQYLWGYARYKQPRSLR